MSTVTDFTSVPGDASAPSDAPLPEARRKAATGLWAFTGGLVALTLAVGVFSPLFADPTVARVLVYSVPPLLVVMSLHTLLVMSRHTSLRSTLRAMGGRSWLYKAALVLGAAALAAACVLAFSPLVAVAESAGVEPPVAYALPAAVFLTLVIVACALVALHLREVSDAAIPPGAVPGSDPVAVPITDAARDAVVAVLTRIGGETDSERLARVEPHIVAGRADKVLDRVRDRDLIHVSVTPQNVVVGDVVRDRVQVGGTKVLAADGCVAATYTFSWTADMSEVDGVWKLYGLRGGDN